jgi:hypothetical protein
MANMIEDIVGDVASGVVQVAAQFSDTVKKDLQDAIAEEERRNKLLNYSPELIPNLNFSPQDFYALVMKSVTVRELPAMESQYLMMSQGGPATAKRLYLQLRRGRMFIELCAMQFGTGFFVSERVFERKVRGPVLRLFGGLFLLAVISAAIGRSVGWLYAFLTFTGLIALALSIMRYAAANAAEALDRVFSDLPIIGPVYEWKFHPNTYFREDTNRAYREAVHDAVEEAKAQIRTQQGSKSSRSGRAPAVDDLHLK